LSTWADPEDHRSITFNSNRDGVNRISFSKYNLDDQGRPLNPMGRTGLMGRGLLGRWGVNHAADPIVSRFNKNLLQFVGIIRRDNGELALPGGMVDHGELISKTLVREFCEEALDGVTSKKLENFWNNGEVIYEGYVDDPRNTDNAWIETTVVNFHDSEGLFNEIELKAGDDASKVHWIDVKPGLSLYASHGDFIAEFARRHNITF